jgi:RNA polymerase sigma factor (sigma-70 family)
MFLSADSSCAWEGRCMPVLEVEPRINSASTTRNGSRRTPAIRPDEIARLAVIERERELRHLIELHGEAILLRCLRVTRDRHDAEDATQQAFIALAKRLAESDVRGPVDRPLAWLSRVAKRCAIDVVRARSSRRSHESAAATHRSNGHVAATDARDATGEVDARLAVQEVLGTLPANYKTPMVLFYFGGQTLDSIAKQLGMTANAVGVKLHRGRSMLAKRLKARGVIMPAAMLSVLLAEVVRKQVSTTVATTSGIAGSGSGATAMLATGAIFSAKARWIAMAALLLGTASTIGAQSSRLASAGRDVIEKVRSAVDRIELPKPSLELPFIPKPIATTDAPNHDDSILRDLPGRTPRTPQLATGRPMPTAAPLATARSYTVVPGVTIPHAITPINGGVATAQLALAAPGRPIHSTASNTNRPAPSAASGGAGKSRNAHAEPREEVAVATPAPAPPAFGAVDANDSYAGSVVTNSTSTSTRGQTSANLSTDGITSGLNLGGSGLSFMDSQNGLGAEDSHFYRLAADGTPRPREYPELDGTAPPIDESMYSPLWPGLRRTWDAQAHALAGQSVVGGLAPGSLPEPSGIAVVMIASALSLKRWRR